MSFRLAENPASHFQVMWLIDQNPILCLSLARREVPPGLLWFFWVAAQCDNEIGPPLKCLDLKNQRLTSEAFSFHFNRFIISFLTKFKFMKYWQTSWCFPVLMKDVRCLCISQKHGVCFFVFFNVNFILGVCFLHSLHLLSLLCRGKHWTRF